MQPVPLSTAASVANVGVVDRAGNQAMLHLIAATLSLLLLAGVFGKAIDADAEPAARHEDDDATSRTVDLDGRL
ncbi:MAG TPA: hypothetical protein VN624_13590 [Rhodanobacter sp.]|nr:hypothetical protein [Rhodanobacter sp.]